MEKEITGEYKEKGDYHKRLDKNWRYLPIYLEKIKEIDKILAKFKGFKILDAGCGEGFLVDKYKEKGFDIVGLDLNYSSKNVKRGDIKNMPFKNNFFDLVLCLDVLEHINISEHEKVVDEIYRITKPKGIIIFGLPNLAHFASRLSFLLTGKLIRTSDVERHIGDRPINEYITIFKNKNLNVIKRKGLFPTFPLISLITLKNPSKAYFLHKVYNKIVPFPNLCFENIILVKKI